MSFGPMTPYHREIGSYVTVLYNYCIYGTPTQKRKASKILKAGAKKFPTELQIKEENGIVRNVCFY